MTTTTGILFALAIFWTCVGAYWYSSSIHLLNKAWNNKRRLRCILFTLMCGPLPVFGCVVLLIRVLSKVFRSWFLLELPDELEEKE